MMLGLGATDASWRLALLDRLLWVLLAISAPVLLYAIVYSDGWLAGVIGYALLVAVAVLRGISFKLRASALVLVIFLVGAWGITSVGVLSSGRLYLGLATFLACLFLGGGTGLAVFLLGVAAIIVAGVLVLSGVHQVGLDAMTASGALANWVLFAGSFVVTVGLIAAATLFVIGRMERMYAQLAAEMEETERLRRAEHEHYQHVAFVAANASDSIWMSDLALNITYVSESVTKLRGFTPAEVMEQGVSGSLAVDSLDEFKRMIEARLADDTGDPGRSTRLETRLRHKDGHDVDVEINVSFLRDECNQPVGLIGVTRDISDRKRLEAAMESVIRGTRPTKGMMFLDALAKNLAEVLGVTSVLVGELIDDEVIQTVSVWEDGQRSEDFQYSIEHTPCAIEMTRDVCSYRSRVQQNFPQDQLLADMDAESYLGAGLFDGDGNKIGVLACIDRKPLRDAALAENLVTIFAAQASAELARQRAERERESIRSQLVALQRIESVGQLAGGIAHDFNNLLVVIGGFAEMAEQHAESDPVLTEYLGHIRASTERAAKLTRQLLAFSRRQVMEACPLDLSEVLSNMRELLARLLPENIDFELVVERGIGVVEGDRGELEQALMNTVVNARDAMSNGGKLSVRARNVVVDQGYVAAHPWASTGSYVEVSVADTGIGIPQEIQDRVWEPFFTTKLDGAGTGLGLSSVFGIVKQHGGFVSLTSEPGVGTEVKMFLPIMDETQEQARTPVRPDMAAAIARGTGTVLVAEDEAGVRDIAKAILSRAGYKVLLAEDGEIAIEMFERHQDEISVVILDVVMPRMGGREVMERIKAIAPGMPIVFASGYAAGGIHSDFILEDGLELLQKPYSREQLLSKVREALDSG